MKSELKVIKIIQSSHISSAIIRRSYMGMLKRKKKPTNLMESFVKFLKNVQYNIIWHKLLHSCLCFNKRHTHFAKLLWSSIKFPSPSLAPLVLNSSLFPSSFSSIVTRLEQVMFPPANGFPSGPICSLVSLLPSLWNDKHFTCPCAIYLLNVFLV